MSEHALHLLLPRVLVNMVGAMMEVKRYQRCAGRRWPAWETRCRQSSLTMGWDIKHLEFSSSTLYTHDCHSSRTYYKCQVLSLSIQASFLKYLISANSTTISPFPIFETPEFLLAGPFSMDSACALSHSRLQDIEVSKEDKILALMKETENK